MAALGEGGTEVPAAVLPCASCHGFDGVGRPEGGVVPSDITWQALQRPAVRRDRSSRPPYDERLLIRAITMGRDSGGSPLHSAMPRYRLTREEAVALVAYLRLLGTESAPGVSDTAIRLGVVLPPGEGAAARRQAIRGVLDLTAGRASAREEIYGRRIELRFLVAEGSPAERIDQIRAFLNAENPFALLAPHAVGIEEALARLLAETGVPAIGPVSAEPARGEPPVAEVFYLLPGLRHQVQALLRFAESPEPLGAETVAVVFARGDSRAERLASEIVDERAEGVAGARVRPVPVVGGADGLEGAAGTLRELRPDAILLLLPRSAGERLLLRIERSGEPRPLLLVGSLYGSGDPTKTRAPEPFSRYYAWPTLPQDTEPAAWASYRERVADAPWAREHRAAQLYTLAALEVIREALRKVGRRLGRQGLIEALETLYQYETGYSPAVTFHPNRRVGALGAWIVGEDSSEAFWQPIDSGSGSH